VRQKPASSNNSRIASSLKDNLSEFHDSSSNETRAASLVEHVGEGYQLTECGRELVQALMPLSDWASRWGAAMKNR
jgi:DNA-binding HxlR family transcriptional regulator